MLQEIQGRASHNLCTFVKFVSFLTFVCSADAPFGHFEVHFRDVRVPVENLLLGEQFLVVFFFVTSFCATTARKVVCAACRRAFALLSLM